MTKPQQELAAELISVAEQRSPNNQEDWLLEQLGG